MTFIVRFILPKLGLTVRRCVPPLQATPRSHTRSCARTLVISMPYSSSHGTNLLWRPCHPLNRHHQPSGDAVLEGAGVVRTSIPGGGEALQGTGGTGWSSRKRRPKALEGATPRCHGRQVRAAWTSVVRKGRWRKISSRRSSPRELIVVGLDITDVNGTDIFQPTQREDRILI